MARRPQVSTAAEPSDDSFSWLDANARLVEGWFELQSTMWQSWVDIQAEWMRQCQLQTADWPSWPGAYSGAEQLA